MRELAIVALPEAYLTSFGAVEDAVRLIDERRVRVMPEATADTELRLHLVSPDGSPFAVGSLTARPEAVGVIPVQMDFIWLPGFRIGAPDLAAERIRKLAPLGDWLVRQAAGGAIVGGSGASVLLLIAWRLLTAARVPMSTAMLPLFQALYPRIGRDERQTILQQGNIYASAGFGHDIELVAMVLERLASPASSAWYRAVAGIERAGLPDLAEDPLVSAAQLRIEQRFATRLSISGLAAELATTHATLIRRFDRALGTTPGEYLRDQRLAAARRLLTQTSRPVGTIARMVGFTDLRSFRELFRSRVGMSASTYRRRGTSPIDHIGD